MVSVLNLIVTLIVTMSILKIESYANEETRCYSNHICIGHQVCDRGRCVGGCLKNECHRNNEECLTVNHIPKCVCKMGFIRKRNGECESPICTDSLECFPSEICRLDPDDNIEKCQCEIGLKENPYSEPRCKDDESVPSCGSVEDCVDGLLCYKGKCVSKCLTMNCPENEECLEEYGRCFCKDGYRRNAEEQCVHFCVGDDECNETEACIDVNGLYQCGCPDGFQRDIFPPFLCREPCESNTDCRKNQLCSENRCVQAETYHPRPKPDEIKT